MQEAGIRAVLKKPFSLAAISKEIRAILDPGSYRESKLRVCGN
jgi:hypothetical protein